MDNFLEKNGVCLSQGEYLFFLLISFPGLNTFVIAARFICPGVPKSILSPYNSNYLKGGWKILLSCFWVSKPN